MIVELAAVTVGVAMAAVTVTAGFVALVMWILLAIDARTEPDDPTGTDGGGQGVDDRPGPPSDRGGEPAWWPEFERELARYVAEPGRRSRPVTIAGA